MEEACADRRPAARAPGSSSECSHQEAGAGVAVEQRVVPATQADQPEREFEHVLGRDLRVPKRRLSMDGRRGGILMEEFKEGLLDDRARRRVARRHRRIVGLRIRSRPAQCSRPARWRAARSSSSAGPARACRPVFSWSVAAPASAWTLASASRFVSSYLRSAPLTALDRRRGAFAQACGDAAQGIQQLAVARSPDHYPAPRRARR